MRKITKEAVNAFENGHNMNKQNMSVEHRLDWDGSDKVAISEMRLHGNLIARTVNGTLFIDNCGWATNTTKERLNGLEGVSIHQKDWQWYLNGRAWGGSYVCVDGYGE